MNGKAWKAFLNPGWIFTFILIITFTYVAFTVLAPWQLGKSEVVSHRNDLIAEHFDKEPAPFDSVFTAGGVLPQTMNTFASPSPGITCPKAK